MSDLGAISFVVMLGVPLAGVLFLIVSRSERVSRWASFRAIAKRNKRLAKERKPR